MMKYRKKVCSLRDFALVGNIQGALSRTRSRWTHSLVNDLRNLPTLTMNDLNDNPEIGQ